TTCPEDCMQMTGICDDDCTGLACMSPNGCTCVETPMGNVCAPNCTTDDDCPMMGPMQLICGDGGYCTPDDGTNTECGNGICELGEDEATCPEDCSDPDPCGDGVCDAAGGEDEMTCPEDCDETVVDRSTWVDPPTWEPDADGVYQLRMEPAAVEIDGTTYCLRTWNGAVPGPTLRIAPQADANDARQIRIDFANGMSTEDMQPVGMGPDSVEYDFNLTNLHTHGFHVQPEYATGTEFLADNVLVHHAAGVTAEYRFDIDEDQGIRGRPHEPGTFWYHPHVHGSTSIQVANGMTGAIIIEGDVDALDGIAESDERIFVMNHMPLSRATPLPNGMDCTDDTLSINNFMTVAGAPDSVQVNGVVQPRIVVPPGQVERWRMIHAGITQEMNLGIYPSTDDNCSDIGNGPLTFHQIAQDSITMHAMDERTTTFMAPGNRADLMVTAPDEEGVYCLAYEQGGGPMMMTATMVVAILEVSNDAGEPTGALPSDADLDATALPLLDCNAEPDGTQDLIFSQQVDSETGEPCEGGQGGGLLFNINCRTFDHHSPRELRVDVVEEWVMNSEGGGSHPFHIHVNPFQVCEGTINGETLQPHWRDTVWVEQSNNGNPSIVARYPSETYTGSFMLHCHKLHHEDQGMMELITINPDE
ncbi:MAG: multicopper oxidase family protein, partial [Myxococcota bacterium]